MRAPSGLAALVLVLLVTLVLSGCSTPEPGETRTDVDTPALRQAREQAGVEPCRPGGSSPVEGGLPAMTLPCLGGGDDVDLSTLEGPMVVSFWASWCAPCREEMPVFQAFHERYGDRVPVLGIDYQDAQPAAALELVTDTGATYPQLADPGGDLNGAAPLPRLPGMPFLVLLGADGTIAHREFVEVTDVAQLRDLVDEHLGVEL